MDRGNQNAEVMHFLYNIKDRPNVCLLEGNHERWIRDYGHSVPAKSREFEDKTKGQLILGGFDEKMARIFYRKLRQMSHFTWNGLEILACHGGIPCMRANLTYIPTEAFVHGVGEYKDYQTIADTWMSETKENQYLVHGHRNTQNDPVQLADRVFNLEGEVEFGGKLRIVELTTAVEGIWAPYLKDDLTLDYNKTFNWNVVELNDCQPITEDLETEKRPVETIEEAIVYLRNNKFVNEKKLGDNISSFNFSREAFYSANWNRQTILARGLFIDTANNKIMARSYEKFFKINEVHATELINLKATLQFPVKAYIKENGFLAIVSYDYNNDDLFIASKSTNKGDYVEYIKAQLEPYKEKVLDFLREQSRTPCYPLSLVFECCDPEHDPHIIKYDRPKLVLLDAISNKLEFRASPYDRLKEFAEIIGCLVKEEAFTIKDWDDFRALYNETQDEEYKFNGKYIEGFVFVDANGFMTKCKTGYYNAWKHLRGVADSTLRSGNYRRTGSLLTVLANKFYGFCRECFKNDRNPETKDYPYKTDIISMREYFETGIPVKKEN